MTDFRKLGEDLRAELGDPPEAWVNRQRAKLRDLDLGEAKRPRSPVVLAAALVVGGGLAVGAAFWLFGAEGTAPFLENAHLADSAIQNDKARQTPATGSPPSGKSPIEDEARWVEATVTPHLHRLEDGSTIELAPLARGRLDERAGVSTRFDLHSGTATFAVEPRKGEPFTVVIGQYRVVVVGTRFTTAYVPPSDLNVVVSEGKVQVHLPNRADALSVSAGEVLEVRGQQFALRHGTDEASGAAPSSISPAAAESQAKPGTWKALYRAGKYTEACVGIREASAVRLNATLDVAELIELSSAQRLCGDTKGAVSSLDAVRARYPGSPQAHDALFLTGRIRATEGQTKAAITLLESYLASSAGGRFTAEALGRLIELHEAVGDRYKARTAANKYLQVAPQGPYRRLAEGVVGRP